MKKKIIKKTIEKSTFRASNKNDMGKKNSLRFMDFKTLRF